ncbi:MAG: M15 family metallopeptidase [Bifidobacteriaceae bacterium]|nr:M15 family metallopeptidase [Bifidobacteriaceae bacterium]
MASWEGTASADLPQSRPPQLAQVPAEAGFAAAAAPAPTRPSSAPAATGKGFAGGGRRGRLTEADGKLPEGSTVFDSQYPGIANLSPALLEALRKAAGQASSDAVVFEVNSGWRSAAYQGWLLGQAVAKYGSEEEAARWVAIPDKSLHVSGQAVDLGADAAEWLADHGAGLGLCQVYQNEPWHFELRLEAPAQGCPAIWPDPTHDPRLN